MKIKAIVAADENLGIGLNGTMPWHIPEDMQHFKQCTEGHAVLMGRKTYESLPPKFRPLPKRLNIVATRDSSYELPDGVGRVSDPVAFLKGAKQGEQSFDFPSDTLWVIGGGQIYAASLELLDELYFTKVHSSYDADAFFPEFRDDFELVGEDKHEGFSFQRYVKRLEHP